MSDKVWTRQELMNFFDGHDVRDHLGRLAGGIVNYSSVWNYPTPTRRNNPRVLVSLNLTGTELKPEEQISTFFSSIEALPESNPARQLLLDRDVPVRVMAGKIQYNSRPAPQTPTAG